MFETFMFVLSGPFLAAVMPLSALLATLYLFVVMTIYLAVRIRHEKYLTFITDALLPSLKIACLQVVAYFALMLTVGMILLPVAVALMFPVFSAIHIYFGQAAIHAANGRGTNKWATRLLGIPSAVTLLASYWPSFYLCLFLYYEV